MGSGGVRQVGGVGGERGVAGAPAHCGSGEGTGEGLDARGKEHVGAD